MTDRNKEVKPFYSKVFPFYGVYAIRNAILASLLRADILIGFGLCTIAYQGLKIITSLRLRFPDFQRRKNCYSSVPEVSKFAIKTILILGQPFLDSRLLVRVN